MKDPRDSTIGNTVFHELSLICSNHNVATLGKYSRQHVVLGRTRRVIVCEYRDFFASDLKRFHFATELFPRTITSTTPGFRYLVVTIN